MGMGQRHTVNTGRKQLQLPSSYQRGNASQRPGRRGWRTEMDARGGGGVFTKLQIHTADIKCDSLSDDELNLLTAEDRRWKQEATSPRITFNSTGRHSGQPASGVPVGVNEHMAHSQERQSTCKGEGERAIYLTILSVSHSFIIIYCWTQR